MKDPKTRCTKNDKKVKKGLTHKNILGLNKNA